MTAPDERQVGGDHYKTVKVQPWDAMEAWSTPGEFRGYLRLTAVKYLARCNLKGGREDIQKAIHFLEKLVAVWPGETPRSTVTLTDVERTVMGMMVACDHYEDRRGEWHVLPGSTVESDMAVRALCGRGLLQWLGIGPNHADVYRITPAGKAAL